MIKYTSKKKADFISYYFQKIVKQQNETENNYKVKFPLNEDIEKIYITKNLNNIYNKDIYIDIVKEKFIRLNNNFFIFSSS